MVFVLDLAEGRLSRIEATIYAPKTWLCEVSEAFGAKRQYWLLGLLVTSCLVSTGTSVSNSNIHI